MTEADWDTDFGRCVSVFLNGDAMDELDGRGEWVTDDSFLLCFNAWHEVVEIRIPDGEYGSNWRVVVDTSSSSPEEPGTQLAGGSALPVPARSLVVLQRSAE